ncbi:MMPL family transporter [Sulfurovum sp. bin170]|uniref:efflux RND transporter permease subunit n=1 Tax=Sulfurovum sp. bin170 TaxID=2695268 RepID=UPI0013DE9924|nr:MMPL family transporter [Sulfurovum sp. bin170]NEW61731.1 MMPL family transporter [Sulfurovum sp. bin170]
MNKYIKFLQKFRWLIAIGLPLVVLLLASNLKHLQMDGSYRIWFGEGSKILTEYDDFRSTFGNDDAIVITIKDENGIFNKKALQSIDNITEALWRTKYIARVDSITNYQYIHANPDEPDDVIVEDFIQNIDKATPEYLANRKEIATNDQLIVNGIISADGTTTMISARLTPKVNDDSDKSMEIMELVDKILAPERERTGYKYWLNGGPPLNHAFITMGENDATTFTPLILILSMALLLLLFRRVSGSLIPIGVVIFTFLTVLAVQVLLGYKLNNFTANLPVFIVAIGIADAVHIYSVWISNRREGMENYEAVLNSMQKNFLPILLTSLTTAIGFATLTISKVIPIFTLGIATASGAILAFIVSIIWMPTILLLLKKEVKSTVNILESEDSSPNKTRLKPSVPNSKWIDGYGAFIIRNNKMIIAIGSIAIVLFSIGLFKVKVDSNTIRYFDKSVEFRKSTEFMMDNLTGPMSYEIVVDSKSQHGIKEPKFMRTVEQFYEDFQAKYSEAKHITSLVDTVKRFNKVLNGSETIPESRNLIAQYLLFYSFSLPQGMEINDKMDIHEQKLRVTAQMDIVDTSKDLEMLAYIEDWWDKTEYSASIQGQTKMFAHMQKDVTDTLIYSLSLAIILVSIVMLMIFRRIKLLWVFILPNILPVLLVVGLMGWIGINIDIGVAISGAIIIGVAVDDTIHFLVKYFDARKRGLSLEDSFDEVLRYAGKAILFTTIILSMAFSIFAFSHFVPNQNFGIVTAFALVVALVVDLLLLPALLSLVDGEECVKRL